MTDTSILSQLAVNEIKTQSDYLAQEIKEMIVSGEISDGFRFPNENEFRRELNVSRATLREAYKILDTQGFIQRTRQGTVVKDKKEIARDGNFTASLELAYNEEIIEFACALEPEAVYLAAKKADEKKIEKLEALLIECEESSSNARQLMDTNYRFHAYIREMAENNLITSVLSAYYDMFNHQVVENIYKINENPKKFKNVSLQQHRAIFEAIKDGKADVAQKLAHAHLQGSVEFQVLQLNQK